MLKVMLIEDDRTMVSLLSTLLSLEGFSTLVPPEYQLKGVIESLKKHRPEIALVDVNLRTVSGLEVVREIRQDRRIKDTLVLMCSGLDLKQQCLTAGADGFLLKPFMPDELIKQIRTHLQSKEKTKNKEKR